MANKWIKDTNLDASGRYKFTYTADKANSEYNYMILETENKFVDKNIFILANVLAGSLTASTGAVSLSNHGATGLLGNVASSVPNGNYIEINGSGAVIVNTAGWINANSTANSDTATIYFPINSASFTTDGGNIICSTAGYVAASTTVASIATVSVTTSFTMSNSSTYFTTGTSSDKDVTVTPKYTVSAGYVSTTSNKNNGGVAYWKIRTTTITTTPITISNDTVTQQAGVSWNQGWVTTGSITAATFSSTFTGTDNSYTDISNTDAAPALVRGSYLYVNEGYTSKIKISLAKLIPDDASITGGANGTSNKMLKNVTAFDNEGNLITGTIESLAAHTYTPSTATLTIAAGLYLSGDLTIEGDANLIAANIVTGKTIFGVEGTFSAQSTSAITSSVILENYVGYVNGLQVTGSMKTRTVSVTYTPTSLTTYFTDLGTTATEGTYLVTIVPKYTVSAGYVAAKTNKAGTTRYYQIKTATLSATAGDVTLTSDTTAQSSTTPTLPFSIYSSSVTRNINITTTTATADMGTNRVYIKIEGSGAVAASTTGWLTSTDPVSSTTATRYISLDYYTGTYTTG